MTDATLTSKTAVTSATLHSVGLLAENLLYTIFGHLPQRELLICLIVLPDLRSTIGAQIARRKIRCTAGEHISQHYTVQQMADLLKHYCTSLELHSPTRITSDGLLSHIQHFERLRHLRIEMIMIGEHPRSHRLIIPTLSSSLQTLAMGFIGEHGPNMNEALRNCQPGVFRKLHFIHINDCDFQYDLSFLDNLHLQLDEMFLSSNVESPDYSSLYNYLHRYPAVPKLEVCMRNQRQPFMMHSKKANDGSNDCKSVILAICCAPLESYRIIVTLPHLIHVRLHIPNNQSLDEWLDVLPADNRIEMLVLSITNCELTEKQTLGFLKLQRLQGLNVLCECTLGCSENAVGHIMNVPMLVRRLKELGSLKEFFIIADAKPCMIHLQGHMLTELLGRLDEFITNFMPKHELELLMEPPRHCPIENWTGLDFFTKKKNVDCIAVSGEFVLPLFKKMLLF